MVPVVLEGKVQITAQEMSDEAWAGSSKACRANGSHPAEMDLSEIKKQKSEFLS